MRLNHGGVKTEAKRDAGTGTSRKLSLTAGSGESVPTSDTSTKSAGFGDEGADAEDPLETKPASGDVVERDEDIGRDDNNRKDVAPDGRALEKHVAHANKEHTRQHHSHYDSDTTSNDHANSVSDNDSTGSGARTPNEDTTHGERKLAQAPSDSVCRESSRKINTARSPPRRNEQIELEAGAFPGHGLNDKTRPSPPTRREDNKRDSQAPQAETHTDRPTGVLSASEAIAKAQQRERESTNAAQHAHELEESGSVGESVHSRWSLPSGGGGGGGGLHEQRAMWGGPGDEADSTGSVEQAPSSHTGERGSDGKSPRSRVESYDLQQEPVSGGL